MASPAATDGVRYSLCTVSEIEEMVHLLGEAFARRDPLAVAVGLTVDEFQDFAGLVSKNAAGQGLTIVARSVVSGEMAGVLLTEDSATPLPDGMEGLSPKVNPIFDILGQLETAYRGDHVPAAGESAHFFLLGVAERFAGRGIARQLVAECLGNATRKGYRVAVTEATSRTSQHIFRREGFAERVRGSYRDHRYKGRACFASIAEHGGPVLMDRLLQA